MADEQPRDEKGQFASTGGGSAPESVQKQWDKHPKLGNLAKGAKGASEKATHLGTAAAHDVAADAHREAMRAAHEVEKSRTGEVGKYHEEQMAHHQMESARLERESSESKGGLKEWAAKKVGGSDERERGLGHRWTPREKRAINNAWRKSEGFGRR